VSAPYTLIVNSSDNYSDCWSPFFTLLDRYWPDLDARVILNTERAVFTLPSTHPVESSRVQEDSERRLTWSECLLRCLDLVETPVVLYMQEDYFLEERVDHETITAFVRRMIADPRIRHLGLTAFGSRGAFERTDDEQLWKVDRKAPYRISLQAALWRTDAMRSYLRPEENGWMFEIYGTRRAWRCDELFLTVNRDLERIRRVLPYSMAGIVKGRWWQTMPALFVREGIPMDFSRRGFFVPRSAFLEKLRTMGKLLENPGRFIRGILGR